MKKAFITLFRAFVGRTDVILEFRPVIQSEGSKEPQRRISVLEGLTIIATEGSVKCSDFRKCENRNTIIVGESSIGSTFKPFHRKSKQKSVAFLFATHDHGFRDIKV